MSIEMEKPKYDFQYRAGNPCDDAECIDNWQDYLAEKRKQFKNNCKKKFCYNMKIDDFELVRTIGVGGFGRVILAYKKENQQQCAVKVSQKRYIVKKNTLNHLCEEIKILNSIDFPLAISLEYFFHDNTYLYFVMPFIPGGDLFSLMTYYGKLCEEDAKFYSAQMVLALEFMHYLGIVHRDLKLENILIDCFGYIKISDFGLSKILSKKKRTYTLCGTTDYLSPEMIQATGYAFSTDWWSLGVLIYEICSGKTPFHGKTQYKTFHNIINCLYVIPPHFSQDLKYLISNLLLIDITKRFGCTQQGADAIKNVKWFNRVDWLDLINKKFIPPYVPNIRGPLHDSLFAKFSNHMIEVSPIDEYEEYFRDICNI